MPLDASLASIPGLAGFLAKKQMNEQGPMQDMQQATQALSLSSLLGQKKDEAQIKAVIESGAPPEKVVNALLGMGPKGAAAAHQYATAMKDMQAAKTSASLQNLTPAQLQDPDTLERLGASGIHGTAHLSGVGERLRKKAEAEAALKTMRRTQGEDGTMTGGHFASLIGSEIPAIANQARTAQSQLDIPNSSIPPQHWVDLQKSLAAQEVGHLERKTVREEKAKAAKAGLLGPDEIKLMAEQARAGDSTVFQNLGRGAQGAENIVAVRKELTRQVLAEGGTGKDVAAAVGEFQGFKAGQRTLGTREAQIEMAGNVTKQFAPLALEASQNFDRTQFKTLNDVEKAVLNRTASPELRRFNFANNALINAYARAVNPTGVGTVDDKAHAREILDTGYSKGDYAAAVDQLNKEIEAELKAPGAVKRGMRDFLTKGSAAQPAPAVATPAAPNPAVDALLKKYGG